MINRSLKVRVATYLLIPMAALALMLAIGGTWFVDTFVTRAFDQLISGSVSSISDRILVQDGDPTVDLPTAAFSILSNSEKDSIFYSVTADGDLLTGYDDLPQPSTMPPLNTVQFRDGIFRGQRVRIGMLRKPLYVTNHIVLVQVAQTTHGRDLLARRMLYALAMLGTVLVAIGSLLIWFAVRAGLTPLDRLRREVESRKQDGSGSIQPFAIDGVPTEALPLVVALNDLLQQLNHSICVIRQFTADASHQLRTPIAILKTHLDLLDRQPPLSPAWMSSRLDIDQSIVRLERLIVQLLTLASVEEHSMTSSTRERIALGEFVRGAVLDAAMVARKRGLDFAFHAAEEEIYLDTDPLLLGEAIRNLVDNAIRYNSTGKNVCVKIGRSPENGPAETVSVTIEDDGPGIPQAELALVFERFYRIERPGDPSGSGLGLSIVRAFVERIGGTISLGEARSGCGLRATIIL